MTNNNGAAKKEKRRTVKSDSAERDVDSETLADYVMGNLSNEQKREIDSKRRLDSDLNAEIEFLGRAMGDSSRDDGPGEKPSSPAGHLQDTERLLVGGQLGVESASTFLVILPTDAPNKKGQSRGAAKRYMECVERAAREAGVPARFGQIGENGADQETHANAILATLVLAEVTSASSEVWFALGSRASNAGTFTAVAFESSKKPLLIDRTRSVAEREFPYEQTDEGFDRLEKELTAYLGQKRVELETNTRTDAIVHDAVTKGNENTSELATFQAMIRNAMDEAKEDLIPRRVIEQAEQAVKDADLMHFLELVERFTISEVFTPSEEDYCELSRLAQMIGAGRKVTGGIIQIGLEAYPGSNKLTRLQVSHLAHSAVANDRKMAKKFVQEMYSAGGDVFELRKGLCLDEIDVYSLAHMLDAYHRDGQHEEAVQITTRLVDQYPGSDVAIRNHARAMERLPGKYTPEQVLAEYKRAILAENVTESSASWYAAALARYGKLVDAFEARVFACMLDLDDADCLATLAHSVSELVQPCNIMRVRRSKRQLPKEVTSATAIRAIVLAMACKDYGVDAKSVCQSAMLNIGIGAEEIEQEQSRLGEVCRKDRAEFIENLYKLVLSDTTNE